MKEVFVRKQLPAIVPRFTYDGEYTAFTYGGWSVEFKTSGTLTLYNNIKADLFLCGGGESGLANGYGGSGGEVLTKRNVFIPKGTYNIVVGEGGRPTWYLDRENRGAFGGNTSAFGFEVFGGATELISGAPLNDSKTYANYPLKAKPDQKHYSNAGGRPYIRRDWQTARDTENCNSGEEGSYNGFGTNSGELVSKVSSTRPFGENKYPALATGGCGGCVFRSYAIYTVDGTKDLAEHMDSRFDATAHTTGDGKHMGSRSGFAFNIPYDYASNYGVYAGVFEPHDAPPNTGAGGAGAVVACEAEYKKTASNPKHGDKSAYKVVSDDSQTPYVNSYPRMFMEAGAGGSGIVIMRSVRT